MLRAVETEGLEVSQRSASAVATKVAIEGSIKEAQSSCLAMDSQMATLTTARVKVEEIDKHLKGRCL